MNCWLVRAFDADTDSGTAENRATDQKKSRRIRASSALFDTGFLLGWRPQGTDRYAIGLAAECRRPGEHRHRHCSASLHGR